MLCQQHTTILIYMEEKRKKKNWTLIKEWKLVKKKDKCMEVGVRIEKLDSLEEKF